MCETQQDSITPLLEPALGDIERWLSELVEPAFRELRANPESGLTAEQLLANLATWRANPRDKPKNGYFKK